MVAIVEGKHGRRIVRRRAGACATARRSRRDRAAARTRDSELVPPSAGAAHAPPCPHRAPTFIRRPRVGRERDALGLARDPPRPPHAADASAAASPDCSASSWKPAPKYGPRNRCGAGPAAATDAAAPRPLAVEQRMRVVEASDDLVRRDLARRVERHEHRMPRVEVLQPVHPVGDAERPLASFAALADIVPARPHALALGHQRRVAMQHRHIVGVVEGAKQRGLRCVGVGQQLQRLIGMRRDHHIGEPASPSLSCR